MGPSKVDRVRLTTTGSWSADPGPGHLTCSFADPQSQIHRPTRLGRDNFVACCRRYRSGHQSWLSVVKREPSTQVPMIIRGGPEQEVGEIDMRWT